MKQAIIIVVILLISAIAIKIFVSKQKIEAEINSVFDGHRIVYSIKSTDDKYIVIIITKELNNKYNKMMLSFNNCIYQGTSTDCIPKEEKIYPTLLKSCVSYWEEQCKGYHLADFDKLLMFGFSNDYFRTSEAYWNSGFESTLPKLKVGDYIVHQSQGNYAITIELILRHLIRDVAISLSIILLLLIAKRLFKRKTVLFSI